MISEVHLPEGVLRVEVEHQRIEHLGYNKPDPAWQFTDAAGHAHHAEVDGDQVTWPTLHWHPDVHWCADCGDEHDDGWWECPQCGEAIRPGTIPVGPGSRLIETGRYYYLDDEPITAERYRQIAQAAIDRIAAEAEARQPGAQQIAGGLAGARAWSARQRGLAQAARILLGIDEAAKRKAGIPPDDPASTNG